MGDEAQEDAPRILQRSGFRNRRSGGRRGRLFRPSRNCTRLIRSTCADANYTRGKEGSTCQQALKAAKESKDCQCSDAEDESGCLESCILSSLQEECQTLLEETADEAQEDAPLRTRGNGFRNRRTGGRRGRLFRPSRNCTRLIRSTCADANCTRGKEGSPCRTECVSENAATIG